MLDLQGRIIAISPSARAELGSRRDRQSGVGAAALAEGRRT
jgi:hypothetical protein